MSEPINTSTPAGAGRYVRKVSRRGECIVIGDVEIDVSVEDRRPKVVIRAPVDRPISVKKLPA